MAQVGVLRTVEGGRIGFWCPGCKLVHVVSVRAPIGPNWGFNDNYDRPTISPSILVRGTKPLTDEQYQQVMAGNSVKTEEFVCHSFVEEGKIRYLGDCTHALAGQTVDMEAYEPDDMFYPDRHKTPDLDPDAPEYEPVPEFKQDADGNDVVDDNGNRVPNPDAKTISGGQAYRLKSPPVEPTLDSGETEHTIVGGGGVTR